LQNIDPVNFLQPAATVAFSFGLVIYWRYKRRFTKAVPLYSLLAYAGAIALKVVLQSLTARQVSSGFHGDPVVLGAYVGIQTVVFEVGGAFLVATLAVSRGHFNAKDAEGYGLGLALWENGVLLGIFGLVNLTTYYLMLRSNSPAAESLYSTLLASQPILFSPPGQALFANVLGILERVSSLLVHFSWGYLCLISAFFRKRKYFLLALPMGLIDFFVPFASRMNIVTFEFLIFGFGLVCLVLSLGLARREIR
jgi:hypothetical protein